jgi:hypothetical protein
LKTKLVVLAILAYSLAVDARPACIASKNIEDASDNNVLTCPIAVAGKYRVRFVMSVSAASAATLGWTMTWRDNKGVAQTPANLAMTQSGMTTPALTFTTSTAGNFYGYADIDVNKGTNVVIKFTFSGGSISAKALATIERIIRAPCNTWWLTTTYVPW